MSLLKFTCPDCAKTFRAVSGLRSHCSAKKHGDNRPNTSGHRTQTRQIVDMGTHTMVFVAASKPETGAFGTWGTASTTTGAGLSPTNIAAPAPQTHYPWKCDICELSYKSKKELDGHMKKSLVHPKCGKCQQGFADQETLQLHIRTLHRSEKCTCGEVVKTTMMPGHLQTSIRHLRCSVCGQGFKDHPDMLKHQKACHLEGYCSGCDLWYPSKQQLQKHFYNSYSHSHCVECEVGFEVKDDFGEHLATVHCPAPPAEVPLPDTGHSSSAKSDGAHDGSPSIDTSTQTDSEGHEVVALDDEEFDLDSPASLSFLSASSDEDAYVTARTITEDTHSSLTTTTTVMAETLRQDEPPRPAITLPIYDNVHAEAQHQSPDLKNREISEGLESTLSTSDDVRSTSEYSLVGSPIVISPDMAPAPVTIEHDYRSGVGAVFDPVVNALRSDACVFGLSTRPSSPSDHKACATSPPGSVSDLRAEPEASATGYGPESVDTATAEEASMTTESSVTPTSSSSSTEPTTSTTKTLPQARAAAGPLWHCRSCGMDPCEDPTATQCGHIFCHSCIVKEIAQRMACPVCGKLFLLRLNT